MPKHEAGLTLLEVAIALSLITIALVPTATMWVTSAKATRQAELLAKSEVLAQRILESQVRDVAYSQQVATSGIDVASGFSYEVTLGPQSLGPALGTTTLRRALVTIRDRDGELLTQLTTLTAKEDNR